MLRGMAHACMTIFQAVVATKKERLVHRKRQHKDFELVKESKVIWEHLRPHKPSPGKSLAREELMALAQGHFKEVKCDRAV